MTHETSTLGRKLFAYIPHMCRTWMTVQRTVKKQEDPTTSSKSHPRPVKRRKNYHWSQKGTKAWC